MLVLKNIEEVTYHPLSHPWHPFIVQYIQAGLLTVQVARDAEHHPVTGWFLGRSHVLHKCVIDQLYDIISPGDSL
jgi:hypothetical protein